MIACTLITGLAYPIAAAVIAIVYVLARAMYHWGYRQNDVRKRGFGGIPIFIINFFMPIFTIVACV